MSGEQLNFAILGTLDAGILEQDRVWRDATGRTRRLEELDTDHLRNLEPFLRRHGKALRMRWLHVAGAMGGPGDNGGNMDQAREDWVRYEMTRPLDEWLGDRPLVRRIRAILTERLGVAATARRPWLKGRKT